MTYFIDCFKQASRKAGQICMNLKNFVSNDTQIAQNPFETSNNSSSTTISTQTQTHTQNQPVFDFGF